LRKRILRATLLLSQELGHPSVRSQAVTILVRRIVMERRQGLLSSLLVILLMVVVCTLNTAAQLQTLNNSTAIPTPGVGHDYIKMLGETVNPANGSVSLRIDVPLPKGRGPNIPFAILYSSSGVHHLEDTGSGARFFTETGLSTGSGWSYTAPT